MAAAGLQQRWSDQLTPSLLLLVATPLCCWLLQVARKSDWLANQAKGQKTLAAARAAAGAGRSSWAKPAAAAAAAAGGDEGAAEDGSLGGLGLDA